MKQAFEYDGRRLDREGVIAWMEPMYTERRLEKIKQVIKNRTRTVAVGLEGLYDRGNVSAVMRSAEALGFFDIHIVETQEKFKAANRVTKGADKWLHCTKWHSTPECVGYLKSSGYKVLVTHLDSTATPINKIAFDQKSVIFFGNEKDGASRELIELSDQRVILPMHGFVESFNISVAAALCLYHIQRDRTERLGQHGDLSEEEQRDLYARYLLKGHKTQAKLDQFEL